MADPNAIAPPTASVIGLVLWMCSLDVTAFSFRHPGLEPGSMLQLLVRLRNGPRLKAGVTGEWLSERVRKQIALSFQSQFVGGLP
jgi:hypothetical protein